MKDIGYDRPLFVQPFDHRGSFAKGFFGLTGAPRIESGFDEHSRIADAKTIVYRGLLRAIELGVERDTVGILVDSQFGSHIIADASARDIPVSICLERSGQPLFDFEYGSGWQNHVRHYSPRILKVLVRFHPADDEAAKREQMTRLKMVSDFVHASNDYYYMFELLVPATTDEDKAAGADYDRKIRPGLMIEAIRELQDFGIEPDIWKIEGLDDPADARAVAEQTRSGSGRERVGSVVLGRGSDAAQVHKWLRAGAPVPGFIGFAVGRTNFSEPIKKYIADPSAAQADAAIDAIARNYKACVDTWQEAKG